jgi:hypothetical protein
MTYNYEILSKILDVAIASPDKFSMQACYGEFGENCIAGWAVEMAGIP